MQDYASNWQTACAETGSASESESEDEQAAGEVGEAGGGIMVVAFVPWWSPSVSQPQPRLLLTTRQLCPEQILFHRLFLEMGAAAYSPPILRGMQPGTSMMVADDGDDTDIEVEPFLMSFSVPVGRGKGFLAFEGLKVQHHPTMDNARQGGVSLTVLMWGLC